MRRRSLADDAIYEAASLWFAQRRMMTAGAFDEAAFQDWLGADPRHQAAYDQMVKAERYVAEAASARMITPPRAGWRWPAVAGVGMAAAAALALLVMGPWSEPPAITAATGIAEIERIELEDGSIMTLGPASRAEVRMSERERRVILAEGEAYFEVAADAERPFTVDAGATSARAVGTAFDVRRAADSVRVAVTEGVVRVETRATLPLASATLELQAGSQAEVIGRSGVLQPAAAMVAELTPGTAGAWRDGHLVYVDAPLSDLVADLNRYHAPGVRLLDPALGGFRLTASFRADDLDTLFAALPAAAPVTVMRDADGEIAIGPAN